MENTPKRLCGKKKEKMLLINSKYCLGDVEFQPSIHYVLIYNAQKYGVRVAMRVTNVLLGLPSLF